MRALDLVALVGVACVVDLFVRTPAHDALSQKRALASTVRAIGAILWPSLLFAVVPADSHHELILVVPLLWNTLVWAIDAYLLHHAIPSDADKSPFASVRFDHSSLAGFAFGLCSLAGSRPDSKYTHIFMYAILGCLTVVLPSHNLKPGCWEDQLFENVQRTVLTWCIGLVMAAVLLTRKVTC